MGLGVGRLRRGLERSGHERRELRGVRVRVRARVRARARARVRVRANPNPNLRGGRVCEQVAPEAQPQHLVDLLAVGARWPLSPCGVLHA